MSADNSPAPARTYEETMQALVAKALACNRAALEAPLAGIDLNSEDDRLIQMLAYHGGEIVPLLASLLAKVRETGRQEGRTP